MSLDILLRPPASRVSWLRVVLNNNNNAANSANVADSGKSTAVRNGDCRLERDCVFALRHCIILS